MQRMRELAVQAATDTNDDDPDRKNLDAEFQELQKELDEITKHMRFNGMKIFGDTEKAGTDGFDDDGRRLFIIQAGPNTADLVTIAVGQFTATFANIEKRDIANQQLALLSTRINGLSHERALLGAQQNRLEFKIASLDISAENLAAAESRIRDADMAKMMTDFTKNNILFQASTAMLAHANALPQGVLQLLG